MIEDNPDENIQSKRKTFAPVAFASRTFSSAQLKMSTYSKIFLGNLYGTSRVCTLSVGSNKANNSSDRQHINPLHVFFQMKAIPPARWNACDYVLQFNFKIPHIAGSVKTAADFVSRPELKVKGKIGLDIREDTQTTPVEMITSSSDVADQEQLFVTQEDDKDESEKQTFQQKNKPDKRRSNG